MQKKLTLARHYYTSLEASQRPILGNIIPGLINYKALKAIPIILFGPKGAISSTDQNLVKTTLFTLEKMKRYLAFYTHDKPKLYP